MSHEEWCWELGEGNPSSMISLFMIGFLLLKIRDRHHNSKYQIQNKTFKLLEMLKKRTTMVVKGEICFQVEKTFPSYSCYNFLE